MNRLTGWLTRLMLPSQSVGQLATFIFITYRIIASVTSLSSIFKPCRGDVISKHPGQSVKICPTVFNQLARVFDITLPRQGKKLKDKDMSLIKMKSTDSPPDWLSKISRLSSRWWVGYFYFITYRIIASVTSFSSILKPCRGDVMSKHPAQSVKICPAIHSDSPADWLGKD